MVLHYLILQTINIRYIALCLKSLDISYQKMSDIQLLLGIYCVLLILISIISRIHEIFDKTTIIGGLFIIIPLATGISYINASCGTVKSLRINEYNGYKELRADGKYYNDYIEIYNSGQLKSDVTDIWLSDDETNLKMINLWDVTDEMELASADYLLVSLEDTGLKLKDEGGERIYLTDAGGQIISYVETNETGPELSFGLVEAQTETWLKQVPSPGYVNKNTQKKSAAPVLSVESGFYDSDFELTITAQNGENIYYSLDCSIPTAESSLYEGPINVYNPSDELSNIFNNNHIMTGYDSDEQSSIKTNRAMVIRAVAIGDGEPSDPVTGVYFVGLNQYRNEPVLSVIADSDALLGDDGIYVTGKEYDEWYQELNFMTDEDDEFAPLPNFEQTGKKYEIPALLQYMGENSWEQEIGLRIAGTPRRRDPAIKSLRFFARKEYSLSNIFDNQIFDGVDSHRLSTRGGYGNTLAQLICKNCNVATLDQRKCSLFLNGEYMCETNITEDYDEYYFQTHYGVEKENIIIFKGDEFKAGEETGIIALEELYDYIIGNDMSNPSTYAHACELMDMQSYMEYMCIRTYLGDMDFGEKKNILMWRSISEGAGEYTDGRWRFGLQDLDYFDCDVKYGDAKNVWENNTYRYAGEYVAGIAVGDQPMFASLKKNEEFCNIYMETMEYVVNEVFDFEKAMAVVDEYGTVSDQYEEGNWHHRDREYYEEYFKNRGDYILKYTRAELFP